MPKSRLADQVAEQMAWERGLAKDTDPKKFAAFTEWRKGEFARLEQFLALPRAPWWKTLFGAKAKPKGDFCPCLSEVGDLVTGVVFQVCGTHAKQFEIHSGEYYEQEALVLIRSK